MTRPKSEADMTTIDIEQQISFPNIPLWTLSSSTLHSAVSLGDKHKVAEIVKESLVDINVLDRWGRSSLFHAVLANQQDILELLIKADAKVNISDAHLRTPLHFAANKGHNGCLKLLLQALEKLKGPKEAAEKNVCEFITKDASGVTPLHLASRLPTSKCLLTLLKYASIDNINSLDDQKHSALHWAAAHGMDENVQLLTKANFLLPDIEEKLPIHFAALSSKESNKGCLQTVLNNAQITLNIKDIHGSTALHLAVLSKNREKVDLLLSHKECYINAIDNQNRTPLHLACDRGSISIVKALISSGANINCRDIYGASPLHYAALQNHSNIAKFILLQPGVKEVTTNNGQTALHWAASVGANATLLSIMVHEGSLLHGDSLNQTPLHIATRKCHTSTVDVLLQIKYPVGVMAEDGCTPLLYACQEGNLKIVKLLLKAGSYLHHRDRKGKTALHYAVLSLHLHLTQLLIESGLSVDSCDIYGRTALHLAAFYGSSDVLHLLLEHRANINAVDYEGKSALHWACEEGHINAVTILLDYDAYPNCIDASGYRWTPLDYANRFGHSEVVSALLNVGGVSSFRIFQIAAAFIQKNWRGYIVRRNYPLRKHGNSRKEVAQLQRQKEVQNQKANIEQVNPTKSKVEPVTLKPVLYPYFADQDSFNCQTENLERDAREKEREYFRSRSGKVHKPPRIITHNGVSVRIAEGEEKEIAHQAWLKVLSTLTIRKVAPTDEDYPRH